MPTQIVNSEGSETLHQKGAEALFTEVQAIRTLAKRAADAVLESSPPSSREPVSKQASDLYETTIMELHEKADDSDEPYLSSVVAKVAIMQLHELYFVHKMANRGAWDTSDVLFQEGMESNLELRRLNQVGDPLFDAFTDMNLGFNYAAIMLGSDRFDDEGGTEEPSTFDFGNFNNSFLDKAGLRPIVNNAIGKVTEELDPQTQEYFLGYLADVSKGELEAFGATVKKFPQDYTLHKFETDELDARETFITAFLATEFGHDFGELLLDLAHKEKQEDLIEVLKSINAVRRSANKIGEAFHSGEAIDELLASRIPLAFTKRTTELLALIRRDGISPELIETIKALEKVSTVIGDSVSGDTFTVGDENGEYTSYTADHHPLVITARPYGDSSRLGLRVKLGENRHSDVSVRLDYDKWGLSLDIGSVGDPNVVRASSIGIQIGNHLAEGEKALVEYRREVLGQDISDNEWSGHHVREAFDDIVDVVDRDKFSNSVNDFTYRMAMRPHDDPTPPETTE